MHAVQMPVVFVIDVAIVLHSLVAAALAVLVRVVLVDIAGMVHGSVRFRLRHRHGSLQEEG
jgi:hypothetical protein